jgi:hypothetical protein
MNCVPAQQLMAQLRLLLKFQMAMDVTDSPPLYTRFLDRQKDITTGSYH